MLSSVRVLSMTLAFQCSMLNVLSDMEGVCAGLGGVEGAHGCDGVIQAVQIHWLYDNPQRFEDQNILNVPNASILYTGGWCLG